MHGGRYHFAFHLDLVRPLLNPCIGHTVLVPDIPHANGTTHLVPIGAGTDFTHMLAIPENRLVEVQQRLRVVQGEHHQLLFQGGVLCLEQGLPADEFAFVEFNPETETSFIGCFIGGDIRFPVPESTLQTQ